MNRENLQLLTLKVAEDLNSIEIRFAEVNTHESDGDEDNDISTNYFTCESTNRPHKDLVDSMKKLRKHGLAILGIELADEAKQLREWTVSGIKIDGDLLKKQSRVVLTLAKKVELTGKIARIKTGQVTMYPKQDDAVKYHDADKMTAIIEDIVEECWSYIFDGKCEAETNPQLALFPEQRNLKVA